MDALSDVLRAVRLKGAIFFDVQASDPWAAETPPGGQIVVVVIPHGDAHTLSSKPGLRGVCGGPRRQPVPCAQRAGAARLDLGGRWRFCLGRVCLRLSRLRRTPVQPTFLTDAGPVCPAH